MILMNEGKLMTFSFGGTGAIRLFFIFGTGFDGYFACRQIFPIYSSARRPVCKNSALAKIKERRAALKERAVNVG
jgi:hypothetical protein